MEPDLSAARAAEFENAVRRFFHSSVTHLEISGYLNEAEADRAIAVINAHAECVLYIKLNCRDGNAYQSLRVAEAIILSERAGQLVCVQLESALGESCYVARASRRTFAVPGAKYPADATAIRCYRAADSVEGTLDRLFELAERI